MNSAFKSKYDQMREGKPTEAESEAAISTENNNQYSEAGHIRNLCFIWPDGKQQFLNYSYLVAAEYLPQENTINIEFTTHTVKLLGVNLLSLYDLILFQMVMRIKCIDARYNSLEPTDQPIVNDIRITAKEE